ncbi:FAD-dependent oxidoreductase [Georgenia phoenicis]|uniref:protoporphyrinogen/coproporphyrinogen oxidase n=1 Tax=unclassified Georgenia TaxID=2626815 RepID=UPI0039B06376
MTRDAVVVGAGMGGLTAAHALAAAGLRTLVLEAGDRVGGLVQHARVGGIDVDAGAESFALRRPEVADLVTRLGLEYTTPATASTIWLPDDGGRALTSPTRALLGIPADPLADDVVAIVGPGAAARAAADRELGPSAGADATTLAELVTVRMGADLLERLVRPVARGIHGTDPENLAVDAVAPGLRAALVSHGSLAAAVAATVPDGPAVGCVVGGMWRLPAALAASAEVRTATRVTSVAREADGTWLVHVDDGAAPVRTRRLVLAVPGPETVALLADVLPGEVPEPRAGNPIAQVTLVVDAPELDAAPLGSGVLVGPDAGVRTKALTHATAKWAWLRDATPTGVHVLRLSYGRAGDDPAALDTVDAAVALADASTLLGLPLSRAQVRDSLRVHRPLGLPPSAAADPALRPLLERVRAADGLGVCGAWVAGTGVAAVVAQAQQEAARLLAT